MKIAIIGASSTIGGNLLNYLSGKNIEVVATYKTNKPSKKNNITWKKLDINQNKKNYYKYLGYPETVLNLAWPDIPNYKLKKHFKTSLKQKKFNYNLVKNGLKNLIVLGTCYEYGKVKGRVSEKTKEKPIIPYAIAKLNLLRSIQNLKKKFSFKFTWLRPFFVYGKNTKRQTLYTLIKDLDKNKIKKLKICGTLIRDFVPMSFLCSVITKVIILNKDIGILNVCTGKGISIEKFVKNNIKNKNNLKKIDMNGKNQNNFEPKYFWGDKSKLNKILKD